MTRAVRISTPVIWLKPWDHLAHHCGQPRLPLYVGYSITSVDGSVPQFNILQPRGSLRYKYQQPVEPERGYWP